MTSQLKWKFIIIFTVVLVCVYGMFGRPDVPTSGTAIKQNFINNIKLGLDLRGGSHLVLQVQLQEAIGMRCDQAIDLLT
jgi:preprotein translocase subunit SecD